VSTYDESLVLIPIKPPNKLNVILPLKYRNKFLLDTSVTMAKVVILRQHSSMFHVGLSRVYLALGDRMVWVPAVALLVAVRPS
jgi:hypothetical protein